MKKFFRIIGLFFTMLFGFSAASCSLTGLSVDDAKTNLTEAEYQVTVLDGSVYLDSDECLFSTITSAELDTYLYAEKGEEKIYMFFFYTIDDAEHNYSFMSIDGLRSGQNNNIVYFGTKQAIKDSKI